MHARLKALRLLDHASPGLKLLVLFFAFEVYGWGFRVPGFGVEVFWFEVWGVGLWITAEAAADFPIGILQVPLPFRVHRGWGLGLKAFSVRLWGLRFGDFFWRFGFRLSVFEVWGVGV